MSSNINPKKFQTRGNETPSAKEAKSTSKVEVYGLKIKGNATVGGEGCVFDNREGAAANLPPLTFPKSLESSNKDKDKRDITFRDSEVGGKYYQDLNSSHIDNRKSETAGDGKIVKVKVIGLGATFTKDFGTDDLVNDIVSALKEEKKTAKTVRLQVAKTREPLELYQTLEEAGLKGKPVLEAIEE